MVTSRRCLALVAAMLLLPVSMRAQTACDYATCALRIVPRLSGLDVVRGDGNERAGSLNFLWPSGTLTRAFVEDANATLLARTSVRKRRTAAVFTDAAGLLMAAAVVRGASVGRDRRPSVALGALGVATLAVSVPLQFAADEALSKAVHRFTRRFAR